jgi:hypothetical protein
VTLGDEVFARLLMAPLVHRLGTMAKRRQQSKASGGADGRVCVFCNGRPVTREHVIPAWIADAVRVDESGTFVGRVESVRNGVELPPRHLKSRKDLLSPIRVVCAECNGGWMSDLEGAVRPLLEPMIAGASQVCLTSDEQARVARWAAKKALLLGYAESPPHPASTSRLTWIRQQDGAPLSTWVYLAAMAPEGPTFRGRLHFNTYMNEASTIEGGTFRVCTMLLRRLVVQVLQMDLVTAATAEPDRPLTFNQIAIQVWPTSPLLRCWPPNRPLTEREFQLFADNFTRLNRIRTPS